MPSRYLLDTNICIYTLSGRHADLAERIDRLESGTALISVIVYGELMYGIAKSRRPNDARQRLTVLLQRVAVAELPTAAAARYGGIRAALERGGMPIGANDLWIAAHARAADLTLVTNNEREFRRVPGLKVENWVVA